MKLVIDIPKEFEEHFNKDKFEDSFKRMEADVMFGIGSGNLSGMYELELIRMLKDAFNRSTKINKAETSILEYGTEIKFSDGSIAIIETKLHGMGDYEYILIVDGKEEPIDYLIGKVWKIVK